MINKRKVRRQIYIFIKENYNGYFISIQLPFALRSYNIHQVQRFLKYFLSKFEKYLQGGSESWIRHPYRFMGFYENKFEQETWHIHILGAFINPITNTRISLEQMYAAMDKANDKFIRHYKQRYGLEYDIQPVKSMPRTYIYSTKELLFKGFLDSQRIITSEILFDYNKKPVKRPTKARKRQCKINNKVCRYTIKQTLSIKYIVKNLPKSKRD